jgi:TonB-dependent starch-binding outer membrane protein SusC
MVKTLTLLLFFLIAAMQLAHPQGVAVTGKVIDQASGEPLQGVTILVKGTTVGTNSLPDGTYKVNIPAGGTILVFSFKGFTTQEIVIGKRTVIDVVMQKTDIKVWLLSLACLF